MIAQARITSDTSATVHLSDDTVELTGANLAEVRAQVKQVFIREARRQGARIDIVIVEPDIRHHLAVEPTGRIASRPADDRPVYGPEADFPLGQEETGGSVGPLTTTGHSHVSHRRSATSPVTGEHRVQEFHSAQSATEADDASDDAEEPSRSGASVPEAARPASRHCPSHSALSAPSASTDTGMFTPVSAASSASAVSAPSAAEAHEAAGEGAADSTSSASPASPTEVPGTSASADAPATSATAERSSRRDPIRPGPTLRATSESDGPARPTLHDLQSSSAKPKRAPATKGFPGFMRKATGGLISLPPNKQERHERDRDERIRRPLDGPKNIAVVNLKGGAHKTTATLMLAATLGVARGGGVLAWDNNETRGTLGWRGKPADHHRTALDLLHDLDRLEGPRASVADLDRYVRHQGETRFDILASDEDPGSAASIDGEAFEALDDTLSRFYRIKVVDTGNNVRASNWLAAVRTADQLVIISTVREDTFNAAAWMIDELRATGLASQVDNAVTVLSRSSKGKIDKVLHKRLLNHFGAHTRAVVEVPYEESFVDGSPLNWPRVSEASKSAWLEATALIVDGL